MNCATRALNFRISENWRKLSGHFLICYKSNLTFLLRQNSVSWRETQVVTIQPWLNFRLAKLLGSATGLATARIHEREC